MNRLGITFPGRLGDLLTSLPTARYICEQHDMACDFYTSSYCLPLIELLTYQSFIEHVIIPSEYNILRGDIGIQPWYMPVDTSLYERVYQLGFRRCPDQQLHHFVAAQVAVPEEKIKIIYEHQDFPTLDEPYITVGARRQPTFVDYIMDCPIATVVIGSIGEGISCPPINNNGKMVVDLTGLNFLNTTTWIARSVGFIGASAQLIIAQGFPIPKVVPYDGRCYDERHLIRDEWTQYLVHPTELEVYEALQL